MGGSQNMSPSALETPRQTPRKASHTNVHARHPITQHNSPIYAMEMPDWQAATMPSYHVPHLLLKKPKQTFTKPSSDVLCNRSLPHRITPLWAINYRAQIQPGLVTWPQCQGWSMASPCTGFSRRVSGILILQSKVM